MKILFLSDIHGVYKNLDYIDTVIKRENIDKLVVLGDLYYCGPAYYQDLDINGEKVKDFLTKYKDILICMKGNCDSLVDIKVSDFPICDSLGLLLVDGINLYITHGNEYNRYNHHKLSEGVLIYGHEHVPYIIKEDNLISICVGSISLPRGGSKPSYMIYNNKKFTIYDIDGGVVDSIRV